MPIEMIEPLTQFGVAGLMGVLWVWERLFSRRRERELSEAHERLMGERRELHELIELIQRNDRSDSNDSNKHNINSTTCWKGCTMKFATARRNGTLILTMAFAALTIAAGGCTSPPSVSMLLRVTEKAMLDEAARLDDDATRNEAQVAQSRQSLMLAFDADLWPGSKH